jgi:hypothetical protein
MIEIRTARTEDIEGIHTGLETAFERFQSQYTPGASTEAILERTHCMRFMLRSHPMERSSGPQPRLRMAKKDICVIRQFHLHGKSLYC